MEEKQKTRAEIKGPIVLLKDAWAVFSKNPGTYIKLVGLTYLSGIVLLAAFVAVGVGLYLAVNSAALAIVLPAIVGIPIYLYLQIWISISLNNALLADTEGNHMGMKEALRSSRKFIVPYFITQLIMGIIVLGGTFLFIIPGIILQIWFSLYTFIILRENKSGLRSLLASREYIKGYTGLIFLYGLAYAVIYYILSAIPSYIFEQMDLTFMSSVYSLIINFVMLPIGILFSIGIYHELKRVKGEIVVDNYDKRKYKYIGIGILGLVIPALLVYFGITTVLPLVGEYLDSMPSYNNLELDEYYLEEMQDTPEEFSSFSEAV